jgi:hypothetical protein
MADADASHHVQHSLVEHRVRVDASPTQRGKAKGMRRVQPLEVLSGVLAFALAASLAELATALLVVVSTSVAVGEAVIRFSPRGAVHFATRTFGTSNKPVLLTTIEVNTLVLGALVGGIVQRRPAIAMYGFALWWAVCAAAMWADDTQPTAALPSLELPPAWAS